MKDGNVNREETKNETNVKSVRQGNEKRNTNDFIFFIWFIISKEVYNGYLFRSVVINFSSQYRPIIITQ